MMRFLRNLLITLLILAATIITAVGVLQTWPAAIPGKSVADQVYTEVVNNWRLYSPRLHLPFGNSPWVLWLGAFVACILVIFITLAIRPRRLQIERRVEGGGRVVMTESATRQYLATALAEFGDLVVRRISLHPGPRKSVIARVLADLHTQENVPDLQKRLISKVHTALTRDLGIERVSRVDVQIHKFGLNRKGGRRQKPEVIVGSSEPDRVVPVDLQAANAAVGGDNLSGRADVTTDNSGLKPYSPFGVPSSEVVAGQEVAGTSSVAANSWPSYTAKGDAEVSDASATGHSSSRDLDNA